jgi:hypothetical protein
MKGKARKKREEGRNEEKERAHQLDSYRKQDDLEPVDSVSFTLLNLAF